MSMGAMGANAIAPQVRPQWSVAERERHAKAGIVNMLCGPQRRPNGRSRPARSCRKTAAADDADFAILGARVRGAVDRDLFWMGCPTIQDPFPDVAVHIEESPWIGLVASNRSGSIGDQFATTAVAPAEL